MSSKDSISSKDGNGTRPDGNGTPPEGVHDASSFAHEARAGMDKTYLAELETLLKAEAELARQGDDLLVDPEYRVLREQFMDGDITLQQLAEKVENLSMTRADEDEEEDEEEGDGGEEDDGGEEEGGEVEGIERDDADDDRDLDDDPR